MRNCINKLSDKICSSEAVPKHFVKRSAFTLVETIMTLFVISVVITASIMIFTGKHNSTATDNSSGPWQACDDSKYSGLCATNPVVINPGNVADIDRDKNFRDLDAGGNLNAEAFYNLILGLDSANSVRDYFRSERGNIKVGKSVMRLDSALDSGNLYNNFYISSTQNPANTWILPSSQPSSGYKNNVVIGNTTSVNALSGSNNVIIGNTNTIVGGESENTILGHNNDIHGTSNNFILGNDNNTNANSRNVIVGNNNKTMNTANNLIIQNRPADQKNTAYLNNIQIGEFLYATESSGNYNITFNDDVTVNGRVLGVVQTSSDIRLKNIKSKYKKGLPEILKIEPVTFYYNNDMTATPHIGVLAQDLKEVFPEAVVKMPSGYLGVDTAPVFFATINALNEVNASMIREEYRAQALETELRNLEKEINKLSICKSNSLLSKLRCWFLRLWQRICEAKNV